MSLLASGRFFTIFPAYALRFSMSNPQIKIFPIELPNTRVSIGIATLRNRTLTDEAFLGTHAGSRKGNGNGRGAVDAM
jgi:hypothetical protein